MTGTVRPGWRVSAPVGSQAGCARLTPAKTAGIIKSLSATGAASPTGTGRHLRTVLSEPFSVRIAEKQYGNNPCGRLQGSPGIPTATSAVCVFSRGFLLPLGAKQAAPDFVSEKHISESKNPPATGTAGFFAPVSCCALPSQGADAVNY